ncbi:hypothetical protein PSHT_14883 [Puccinia striiformis]|uniref:Uncharacterized protein n=1 Tax=Puccinia striiformis TaxID=27350 RepID=A0A2S4UHU0_9BASI|nr:hypothetical protein PSHT_14883 [Puccinia striiformis]
MSLAHTTLKRPCPFIVPHIKPQSPVSPLIHDIYGVVPLPWMQEVPTPAGTYSARLVAHYLSFPSNPYHFTIPGNTRNGAEAFVSTMQSTIYWTKHRQTENKPTKIVAGVANKGEFHFKLEFQCPRSGIHIVKPNSLKIAPSQKCDCKSWVWISHHIKTDSLCMAW